MTELKRSNSIYLTYKTRITAEERLRFWSKVTHILLTWYSLLAIIASLSESYQVLVLPNADLMLTVASIIIFALSLVVYGENFNERANSYRECYLHLQSIYNSDCTEEEKMYQYWEVMPRYPNHGSHDYDNMVFDSWIRGDDLYSSKKKILPSKKTLFIVAIRQILRRMFVVLIFIGPVAIVWQLSVAR